MRITNQFRHAETIRNYQQGMLNVNKHNQQISSGTKIQNSYDDAGIYNDGMRLDYEITTLEQVVEATLKSQNFSKNTDKQMQEFSKQLEIFKTKLIQAASDIHSQTSLEAIANDLEGIKDHLINIANTSINGQFLFSGSAVNTKPIDLNGKYHGNREHMKTVGGSKIEIPYNLPGYDVFLGKDSDYSKILTTNVKMADLSKKDAQSAPKYLDESSQIKHMIGLNYVKNTDSINADYDFAKKDNGGIKFPDTYFYLQGTKPDGTSFTSKFRLSDDTSIQTLMDKIGMEFGNTSTSKVVDVTINKEGQLNIKDLTKGNQVINFHLVAATEQVNNKAGLATAITNDANSTSLADVNSLAALEARAAAGSVHITDFTKSNFFDKDGNKTNSFDYDKVRFEKSNNKLLGTISQINRTTGQFATDKTRLSEVAGTGTLYPNSNDKYNIDDHELKMNIKSRTGVDYEVKVKFGNEPDHTTVPPRAGTNVTFEVTGKRNGATIIPTRTYDVWHATEFGTFKTPTKDFTYRQLSDIIGMVASDRLPAATAGNPYKAYNEAVESSKGMIEVNMTDRGQIEVVDKTKSITNIELSVYDATNSDKFFGDSTGNTPITKQGEGSIFGFSQNNAITIDEPAINMFKDLQKMIDAVRLGAQRSDSNSNDPRNTGLQGAISRLDHIMDHVNKEKVKIGSYTNLLDSTRERAKIMKVNVSSVKSDIIDIDAAEAYLNLMQKMMSYQAMLQATSKINQLSLLNYM